MQKIFLVILSLEGKNYLLMDYVSRGETKGIAPVSYENVQDFIDGLGDFSFPTENKASELSDLELLSLPWIFKDIFMRIAAIRRLNPHVIEIEIDVNDPEKVSKCIENIILDMKGQAFSLVINKYDFLVVETKEDLSAYNLTSIIDRIFSKDIEQRAEEAIKEIFGMDDEEYQKQVDIVLEQREQIRKESLN